MWRSDFDLAEEATQEAMRGHDPYVVQAAIASLDGDQPRDWPQIAALYPEAELALPDRLTGLEDYRYVHSSRGEMLRRFGRTREAREAYGRAIAPAHDDAERRLFGRRLAEIESVPR